MTDLFQVVKTAALVSPKVVVAFSGGKDAVVTLDLCVRNFKKVYAFFMYLAPDLSFQEASLRYYENHYGLEILRLPHPVMTMMLSSGSLGRVVPEMVNVDFNSTYNFVREHFNCRWIAAGERINDSLWRRGLIKSGGTINHKTNRFYPVAHWKEADILAYIKHHRLKMSPEYRVMGKSFAGIFDEELTQIKANYPADYEIIKQYYPDADVLCARRSLLLKEGAIHEKPRNKNWDGGGAVLYDPDRKEKRDKAASKEPA